MSIHVNKYYVLPGLLPFGLVTGTSLSWPVVPDPRPLVGLIGFGLSVGSGGGGGKVVTGCGAVVAITLGTTDWTTGLVGTDLAPALESTNGIWDPRGTLV